MDWVTASTTPTTSPASDANALTGAEPADETIAAEAAAPRTGSLSRRMILIAAGWITMLLLVGGVALDRTLAGLLTRQFD